MRQETKENLVNTLYPLATIGVLSALEYFGVGPALREHDLGRLEYTKEFYGTLNPLYWTEFLGAYTRPLVLETLVSVFVGASAAAIIAEPIKKIINKRK